MKRSRAPERLEFYKVMLIHLGGHGSMLVQEIFGNASSFIKKPATLTLLVAELDKLDWYNARQEGLGDLYEGLLEKNAGEKKSGAGQYFTPRPLIDAMVDVMKPTLKDVIQDPAAGTGGFSNCGGSLYSQAQQVRTNGPRRNKPSIVAARFTAWNWCRTRIASRS